MTFDEANQRYAQAAAMHNAGQISREQFWAMVGELKVLDGAGVWWQLSADGQWLSWNGAAWVPGGQGAAAASPQISAQKVQQMAGQAYQAYGMAQSLASGNVAGALTGVARKISPLAGKSEKWWSVVSVLGGGAGGGLWYLYSTLDKGAKPDYITSLVMLLVPVLLAVLRKPIDRLLAPLIPLRQKMPRLLIVGVGVAAPYLMASFLYNNAGISNYPLIRWSVFLGPLLSYLIIRSPNSANLRPKGGLPYGQGGPYQQFRQQSGQYPQYPGGR